MPGWYPHVIYKTHIHLHCPNTGLWPAVVFLHAVREVFSASLGNWLLTQSPQPAAQRQGAPVQITWDAKKSLHNDFPTSPITYRLETLRSTLLKEIISTEAAQDLLLAQHGMKILGKLHFVTLGFKHRLWK